MSTITEMTKDFNNMVVFCDVDGKPVKRKVALGWFNLVEDKSNWKDPIDAVLSANYAVSDIIRSIQFYAGGTTTITAVPDGFRYQNPGYYANIGA